MAGATSSSKPGTPVQVALITGAARRIGAAIASDLHGRGFKVALHCRGSEQQAQALAGQLNAARSDSAAVFCADLADSEQCQNLADQVCAWAGGVDLLVNNASSFFPTPLGEISESDWLDLIGSNLKGPLFLSQALLPSLRERGASIINIGDIHGQRPLARHAVYSAAKAGLLMLTQVLAKDLAPAVRVNAVCPGSILWPEPEPDAAGKARILERVPMARQGDPQDIVSAVIYLALKAPYVTGQILAVDGGRSLNM